MNPTALSCRAWLPSAHPQRNGAVCVDGTITNQTMSLSAERAGRYHAPNAKLLRNCKEISHAADNKLKAMICNIGGLFKVNPTVDVKLRGLRRDFAALCTPHRPALPAVGRLCPQQSRPQPPDRDHEGRVAACILASDFKRAPPDLPGGITAC